MIQRIQQFPYKIRKHSFRYASTWWWRDSSFHLI